ncbi:MAG TPA: class I SAM-dependent methyltransferase [Candidatus Dormibacteraeota bacterium]|nr:class I SAM-dependent methyltransferase [Candidatus Dormibacteraeota bacterium]
MSERPLRAIALEMGTDKQGAHAYADEYETHFAHLRHRPIRLLEIGVGGYADPNLGGESLRMWKEFFPLASIVGMDVYDKSSLAEERIAIVQGDQSDAAFLNDVAARFGPFDIVIDDGSHVCAHVIASFRTLFRHLADDGIYAIEDLQTSYWERKYGGSSGPDRRGTSMTFLQSLVDGLNYAEFDIPDYVPSYSDTWVRSATFYHNLAFIQKGPNLDASNFLPPHPRTRQMYRVPTPSRPKRRPASWPRRLVRRVVPLPVRAAIVKRVRRPPD